MPTTPQLTRARTARRLATGWALGAALAPALGTACTQPEPATAASAHRADQAAATPAVVAAAGTTSSGTMPTRAAAVGVACDAVQGETRSCTYTSGEGRVRIVDSAARTLHAYVADGATWRALPRFYGNTVWSACALVSDSGGVPRADHVRIADVDGDGRADVVVAGYCTTGIGPTGGQPFAVGSVYRQAAPGRYAASDARDSAFTEALPDACTSGPCDVVGAARAAFGGRRPDAPVRGARHR